MNVHSANWSIALSFDNSTTNVNVKTVPLKVETIYNQCCINFLKQTVIIV